MMMVYDGNCDDDDNDNNVTWCNEWFHRDVHHMWAIAVMKEVYSIQRHAKSIDVD
jgi:hypothetical protein